MTRRKPALSDRVDTCLHRSFRELYPGVMVCLCGRRIDDIQSDIKARLS